jgi:hypothetical protein
LAIESISDIRFDGLLVLQGYKSLLEIFPLATRGYFFSAHYEASTPLAPMPQGINNLLIIIQLLYKNPRTQAKSEAKRSVPIRLPMILLLGF